MTTHKHTSTTSTKSDVATQAKEALTSIKTLTASLPIDDAIPDNQMAATKVISRVPLEAMTIAAGVLTDSPEQFPQFDATDAEGAIAYEQSIAPVAQAAQVLSNRLTKSVLKRRTGMAQQTLALYQVMKGTSRLAASEATRTQVKQLKKLLTTNKKSRETAVTQAETATMVKTKKSAKKQALAQANADSAAQDLAVANAESALATAVATGTLPPPLAPAPATGPQPVAPAPVVAPVAPPVVVPGH